MKHSKQWLKRLLFPPAWAVALVAVPSFVWMTVELIRQEEGRWTAYVSYALAAYALCLLCVRIPAIIRAFRCGFTHVEWIQKALGTPFAQRYRQDGVFRAQCAVGIGLVINLLYTALNVFHAVCYRSLWSAALGGYYLLLALLRFMLASYTVRHPAGSNLPAEWRRCRWCGIVLLPMNFALAVVVGLVTRSGHGFVYPGILVYMMAVYAFYALTMAVINLVRYSKSSSPVITATKMITLISAMVSMLALETAMFSQFGGDMAPENQWLMIALTGAGVSVVVIVMSVNMIIKTAQEIKEIERNGREERDF